MQSRPQNYPHFLVFKPVLPCVKLSCWCGQGLWLASNRQNMAKVMVWHLCDCITQNCTLILLTDSIGSLTWWLWWSKLPCGKVHVARIWGLSPLNIASSPTTCKELNAANNDMNLEEEPYPDEPHMKPLPWLTLTAALSETLKQRTELSHIQVHDPEKLWTNAWIMF